MSNWLRKRLCQSEESLTKRKQLRIVNVDEISLQELISACPRHQVKELATTSSSRTTSTKPTLDVDDVQALMAIALKSDVLVHQIHQNPSSSHEIEDEEELDDLQTEILFGGNYEAEATGSDDLSHIKEFSNLFLQDSVKSDQAGDQQKDIREVFVKGLGSLPSEIVSTSLSGPTNRSNSQMLSRDISDPA